MHVLVQSLDALPKELSHFDKLLDDVLSRCGAVQLQQLGAYKHAV